MNAPAVYLALPIAAALAAYFLFPLRPRSVIFISTVLAAGMAWFASVLPIDAPLTVLGYPIPVSGSFSLLGRQFSFDPSLRSAVLFLFIGGAALFGGSLATSRNRILVPVGWIVLSLFSASLFVQPFLYAAFFLFLSVLCLSLLLSDSSHPVPRGAVRWISYSALGMMFLLLAGSELSTLDNLPAESSELQSLFLQLCLGFGLLISFPPFHFWLPDVVDDSSPYSVSFILSLYIGAVIFLLLRFLDGFSWLRLSGEIYLVLQIGGVGMCLVGGVFAVFQSRLGRSIGYLSLCNLGAVLLSLSVPGPAGAQTAMVLLAARGFSLLVWGVSFHALRPTHAGDRLEDLRGVAFTRPLAFSAALLSGLSLVGAPGLISFPPLWALLRELTVDSASGSLGLLLPLSLLLSLAAGVLSVFRFARPMLHFTVALPLSVEKSRSLLVFLLASIFLLVFLGLFPQAYLPWVANSANAFVNIMGIP
jgi:formate hydrogenlyase subunit 3/multisubunit Na+/H+ antiporter MnhD subunit